MVISALTISFPASLPGEAQECKMKAKAMAGALGPGGKSLPFPRLPASAEQSWGREKPGVLAPKTLYLMLWKHLWKYECTCAHLCRPRCKAALWLAVVGVENSGNEFFRSQFVAFELTFTWQSQPVTCHNLHQCPSIWSALAADWQWEACPRRRGESLEGPDGWRQ